MVHEVARMLRHSAPREVCGRTDDGHAKVAGDGDGNHVLVDYLAELDAGVETFRDDVERRVTHDEIETDMWVTLKEAGEQRIAEHHQRGT